MLLHSELQNSIINIKNVNIVTKEYVFIAVFTQVRPLKSLQCKIAFTQYVHLFTVTSKHQGFYPPSRALSTLLAGLP